MNNLPSKIKHIKNPIFLYNTWDPLNEKYVKKIWVYKITKLDREKRDLAWEYYRNRNRFSVPSAMLNFYYKNRKKITVIYFGDPVQYTFNITDYMADKLKIIIRKEIYKANIEAKKRKVNKLKKIVRNK